MPVKPDFRVEGAREFAKAARKAKDKGSLDALKAAYKKAAELVVARALPNVPVVTGRLQASVRALASQSSGRGVAGKASVPYAPAVHWGWPAHNIERNPFLWDALQSVKDQIPDIFWEEVDRHALSIMRDEGGAL